MAQRDENPRSETLVRVLAIIALVLAFAIDSQPDVEIPIFVYFILGGTILGVTDLSKLIKLLGSIRIETSDKDNK